MCRRTASARCWSGSLMGRNCSMTDEKSGTIITWPSDERTKAAFEAYTLALGKVAYAWNYLHERLGALFVAVSGTDRGVALAIWYSTPSDRTERGMLKAAIAARTEWPFPIAQEELKWLMDRAEGLAFYRDNAVHAPASLYVGTDVEMGASFFNGHPRAQNLMGKRLIEEFEWIEKYAEILSRFAMQTTTALSFSARYPWPDRPDLPSRGQKSIPLSQPHPLRTKSRPRRRRSSPV
jgi:hypothetical protein